MARRAEDMLRRMMGMPSHKEERRANRRSGAYAGGDAGTGSRKYRKSGRRYHREPRTDAAALLKSVAVDVEYTEIREFSSDSVIGGDNPQRHAYDEEQVSDVEYMEIRER